MKAIKAIYNFLVGDIVILIGIVFVFLVFTLIHTIEALSPIRPYMGAILIVAILVLLGITLKREIWGRKKKLSS